MRRRLRHRRRQIYRQAGEGGLALTSIGDARIKGRLGEGVSCTVHLAEWQGREVALKLYKAGSIERHARLTGGELAAFEYERNRAFYQAPGLAAYVAEPIAYLCTGGVSAFVQERLDGQLYYHHYTASQGNPPASLFGHVERIVELSHRAGLYDIDLHAGNLMVVEGEGGEPVPKLFDFNFIPFYMHPPNPLVWLLVKTGAVDRRWRDLRKLRSFHDFRRLQRKLAMFAPEREEDACAS